MKAAHYIPWRNGMVFVPPAFLDPDGDFSEWAPRRPFWTSGHNSQNLTDEELAEFTIFINR